MWVHAGAWSNLDYDPEIQACSHTLPPFCLNSPRATWKLVIPDQPDSPQVLLMTAVDSQFDQHAHSVNLFDSRSFINLLFSSFIVCKWPIACSADGLSVE